jgi:hypothetical protein
MRSWCDASASFFGDRDMVLSRRDFLQRSLKVGVGLGVSWLYPPFSGRSFEAWADPAPRKLALLVGINQYQRDSLSLKGCVTDVDLYQELLIHRFGFKGQDIVTLTDEQATRSNIETAFLTHLTEQARSGDVVVFQFSGYGCLTTFQGSGEKPLWQDQLALLPSDAFLLSVSNAEPFQFNGISEDTLALLLRSLPTDQVTTILDVGILPQLALPSRSVRERAIVQQNISQVIAAELNLQERLLTQTNFSREQLQVQRQGNQTPGITLMAAGAAPAALEIDRPDFSAGLFSYNLTRQLWQSSSATTVLVQLGHLSTVTEQLVGIGQQSEVRGQKRYGALPWQGSFSKGLDASIIAVNREGDTAKVWLGSLSTELLEWLQPQSCFWVLSQSSIAPVSPAVPTPLTDIDRPTEATPQPVRCFTPTVVGMVQLRSRHQWEAIVQRMSGEILAEGMELQEAIRVLPRQIPLKLGLAITLNRVERVDAVSFLSIEAPLTTIVSANKAADYLFTKLTEENPSQKSLSPEAQTRYGLTCLAGALLPNTLGDRGEVVKLAAKRLLPMLETLSAVQWLKLLENQFTSPLKVSLLLEQGGDPLQPLLRSSTDRYCINSLGVESEQSIPKAEKTPQILTINRGTPIQYRIQNWNPFPLYLLLLSLESDTSCYISYATEPQPDATRPLVFKPLTIQPGSTLVLPESSHPWSTGRSPGVTQTFFILTAQPLLKTLAKVRFRSTPVAAAGAIAPLRNPLPVVQQLLSELHQLSLPYTEPLDLSHPKHWALDLRIWAMLTVAYRIT